MTFDELPDGAKFTLCKFSTRVLTKRGDYAIKTKGNKIRRCQNDEEVFILSEKELKKIAEKKARARANYEMMRHLNMQKTPYGWE